jgi:eukaryotic-like serine/threonine-protein kinase
MTVPLDWIQARFPSYNVIDLLGSGGFKTVASCNHSTYGSCVLKIIIPSQLDKDRFDREIQATQKIAATCIPSIFEYGIELTEFGDIGWILERRIVGTVLREYILNTELDFHHVFHIARDVLDVLVQAEMCAIVHRDLKPENLIEDTSNRTYVIDFGIARHLSLDALTDIQETWGHGTPGYAPPEQLKNVQNDIDSRSDLFSLAITAYELLTRVNPFREGAKDFADVIRRTELVPLPRIQNLNAWETEFEDFIHSMAAKRPDHRPDSAMEARKWLGEIESHYQ